MNAIAGSHNKGGAQLQLLAHTIGGELLAVAVAC